MLYNIPGHNCRNCGACCGPIPLSPNEQIQIQTYVDKTHPKYNKHPGQLDCKFRVDNSCTIYPVRPILCRLCGVVEGMKCAYGNSHEIDGHKFFGTEPPVGLLNDVIKTWYKE